MCIEKNWNKLLFSDEGKFHFSLVRWRPRVCEDTVKCGGGSFMVCKRFSAAFLHSYMAR